jgi:hypothetical protein
MTDNSMTNRLPETMVNGMQRLPETIALKLQPPNRMPEMTARAMTGMTETTLVRSDKSVSPQVLSGRLQMTANIACAGSYVTPRRTAVKPQAQTARQAQNQPRREPRAGPMTPQTVTPQTVTPQTEGLPRQVQRIRVTPYSKAGTDSREGTDRRESSYRETLSVAELDTMPWDDVWEAAEARFCPNCKPYPKNGMMELTQIYNL